MDYNLGRTSWQSTDLPEAVLSASLTGVWKKFIRVISSWITCIDFRVWKTIKIILDMVEQTHPTVKRPKNTTAAET